jgi:hypothetical protein
MPDHPSALSDFGRYAGPAKAIRRASLSPGLMRFEARLGTAACVTMALFLIGSGWWIAGRSQGLFHAGAIDTAGAAVLTIALAVAERAARQARPGVVRQGRPRLGPGGEAR